MNYSFLTENSYLVSINDIYTNGFAINLLELLSILAVISSILVIINKNPVISVLFLIGLFLAISIYLIMIGLNFIGIAYLLVYIGAVSMLFLFILMLIDIRISELYVNNNNNLFLSFVLGILFFVTINDINLFGIINNIDNKFLTISNNWEGFIVDNYDIVSIGNVLYTNFSIWLIISSLILLLAMVGAIIINIV